MDRRSLLKGLGAFMVIAPAVIQSSIASALIPVRLPKGVLFFVEAFNRTDENGLVELLNENGNAIMRWLVPRHSRMEWRSGPSPGVLVPDLMVFAQPDTVYIKAAVQNLDDWSTKWQVFP